MEKVRDVSNTSIKQKKPHSVVCTTTFSAHSQVIKSVIKKHRYILTSDPVGERFFADPLLFSNYRARNIQDFLVKSDTFIKTSPEGHINKDIVFFFSLSQVCSMQRLCFSFWGSITNCTYKVQQFVTFFYQCNISVNLSMRKTVWQHFILQYVYFPVTYIVIMLCIQVKEW